MKLTDTSANAGVAFIGREAIPATVLAGATLPTRRADSRGVRQKQTPRAACSPIHSRRRRILLFGDSPQQLPIPTRRTVEAPNPALDLAAALGTDPVSGGREDTDP